MTHGKETVNLARPEWALLFHRGVLANPEAIFRVFNQLQERTMSKILESLPMTIVAGIVLTIIMVFATNKLDEMNQSGVEKAVSDIQKKMN